MRADPSPLTADERRRLLALRRRAAVRALLAVAGDRPVWLVGGVLRDALLGLAVADLDAVVDGGGRELAGRLADVLPARLVLLGGKEFAAYRLVGRHGTVDLWDRAGASADADLLRRDFTVDALAWEPQRDHWLDPADGLCDLRARRLRVPRADAFAGDPLRVLRLARLGLTLPGFTADPETVRLAAAAAPALGEVAAERIRDELARIFSHPRAATVVPLLAKTRVYPDLWLGVGVGPRSARRAGAADELADRLGGLARSTGYLTDRLGVRLRPEDLALGRWALTFAALALDAEALPRAVARFAATGYLTRAERDRLLLAFAATELPATDLAARRFLHRLGELWPVVALRLASEAGGPAARARWRHAATRLAELLHREGRRLFSPPRLLSGSEIQRVLALPPGPGIGSALAELQEEQVAGRIRTRRQAAAWLARRAAGASVR